MNWLSRLFNSPSASAKLKTKNDFESLSNQLIAPSVNKLGFVYVYPELTSAKTQQQLMD